jgi:hypothetical protein
MDDTGNLFVFPTVSSGLVFIQSGKEITADLFNITGQLVQTKKIKGNEYFNLAALPAGMYVIKVREDNRSFSILKQ